ncbi:regulator of G-protein signaling 3-like isoform X1 [Larimichthys crocea]|uniref:regulator of G-protein signaling 3-like isoform X1 n=1 Tax=Larimichthys crocea TaxID=215358 RepID=UPI000F5F2EB7|nr:regulator of G-protein signaling 3-like isoform X1 [Larimichthys crocea]
MEARVCSRRRPCGGAAIWLQEAQLKTKRRRTGGSEENRDPASPQRIRRTWRPEQRWSSQSGSRTKTRPGFRCGAEVQSCRPEVRVALIRQTTELAQGLILTDKTGLGSTKTRSQVKSMSHVRSTSQVWSRSISGPLRPAGLVSEIRIGRRRSDRVEDPESCRQEEAPRTRTRTGNQGRPETRRRTKIHPSVFRGRGRLRLSITPEAGQLIIHIHEARGLMGKSQKSCDSYVKLAVTSDLVSDSRTFLNNKNPEYDHSFILCVSDDLVLNRLIISVFSRCSQLIGCMSFGIGSLVSSSKLVTGWFYLLGEGFGHRKHLRVTSQRNKPMRRPGADLRRTPDSAPDTDPTRVTTTNLSNATTGLKDLTNYSLTSSRPQNLDPANISTLHSNQRQATRASIQQLTVNVVRGKDGFGFTICSDCPVRVQAVDSGGPAHQSGLRQGDSVLQLNGLPVETWKCADLAHAIRSCPSHIVLVVWRGLPEFRSGCETLLRPPTHNMTTGRKLLPPPAHSKHGRRRTQGSGVRSSLGALGSLWRDRKENREEEEEEQEVTEYSPCTATLKGTRVTSSHGDNYIILSPVNQGGQLLQPVYHDRNGTIGRLYQTHPSRGQNLHDPQPGSSQRPFTSRTSTLPPPPSTSASSSSAPPSNYGNYQNCTIVQSHLPCSSYGTYVTLAPKTLIFPIFVQPLDLCSSDRTLLMAEEMVLHQADLLPTKVTVLIYSDLLLFTREDEAGRCNVLQSPLYLNTLQLREVSSEPLHIYFLRSSQSSWRCLFSLEAFSVEQKVRVSLCLHDNIQLQLVATETGHTHQLSDLPSDFGLLSLRQSDLLYRPSSPYSSSDPPLLHSSPPYSSCDPPLLHSSAPCSSLCDPIRPPSPYSPSSSFSSSFSSPLSRAFTTLSQFLPSPPPSCSDQRSPVWKERGGAEEDLRRRRRGEDEEEEVEERQQGEGESASETSEHVGGVCVRGLLLSSTHFNEEEESEEEDGGGAEEKFIYRPEVLRRSLSEGSLLQEPRSPRFLSDSTIHRLTCPATFDPDPSPAPRRPSIHTLRKQLTKEGGSLHHMLLLLNGTKDAEFRNLHLKKKTRNLAADVQSRLPFLRRRKNSACVHGNSLEKALRNNRPSPGEVLRWSENLEALLTNQYGLAVFRHFLRSEFSEENLDFWLAVERFKRTRPLSKMAARAAKIYEEFISTNAARQVNVDSSVRESTNQSLHLGVSPASFQLAQDQIYSLMEADSYPRFLRSRLYTQLTNQGTEMATESAN